MIIALQVNGHKGGHFWNCRSYAKCRSHRIDVARVRTGAGIGQGTSQEGKWSDRLVRNTLAVRKTEACEIRSGVPGAGSTRDECVLVTTTQMPA